eukprot:TRINITY_DN49925_c0_g1_i1.p1 TRINITY_DN49925_c0_g1~~TRINITY_DN49925_c0_g1_i1.p1  ORF type:complete len:572 (-),score=50.42 TRINITY_DN49925_c0_g1_i1:223-1938(-)
MPRGRSPPRPLDDSGLEVEDAPSARDLRKYGRLFCRAVGRGDRDALFSGAMASDLLSRSQLPRSTLAKLWDLSDTDRDGQLAFSEFVTIMHLVRRAREGADVMSLDPLPAALRSCVANLEPAEFYASQPSRSRSASPSGSCSATSPSCSSRSVSPAAVGHIPLPSQQDMLEWSRSFRNVVDMNSPRPLVPGQAARDLLLPSGLPEETLREIWHYADLDGVGGLTWLDFVLAMHLATRMSVEREQHLPPESVVADLRVRLNGYISRPDSYEDQAQGTHAWNNAGADGARNYPEVDHFSGDRTRPMKSEPWLQPSTMSPTSTVHSLGTSDKIEGQKKDDHVHHGNGAYGKREDAATTDMLDDGQPVEHLEGVIEADKVLLRKLRQDVELLHAELDRLETTRRAEEADLARERSECERIGEERRHLQQQLDASRRQATYLRNEHQNLRKEGSSRFGSGSLSQNRMAFLEQHYEACVNDTKSLKHSMEHLELSRQSLEAQCGFVEEARVQVQRQIEQERAPLEHEREDASQVKRAMDLLQSSSRGGVRGEKAGSKTGGYDSAQSFKLAGPWRDGV